MIILITGAAGRIGRCLLEGFTGEGSPYQVRAFDRSPISMNGTRSIVGELSDFAALRQAMEGVDVVVHLAGTATEEDFLDDLLPNNITGTYNVMQAAHEANVRRVVFASSAQIVACYPHQERVTIAAAPRPMSLYSVTKAYGEALGRYYFERKDLEFVGVRVGWFLAPDDARLRAPDSFARKIWLSPADAVRLFRCAIEAPVGYALVFGTSRTSVPRLSLHEARDLLGFEPQDDVCDIPTEPPLLERQTPALLEEAPPLINGIVNGIVPAELRLEEALAATNGCSK